MVGMSLTMLILASCSEKLESNSIKSESFTEYFNLTDTSTDDYQYLEVSVKARIPKYDVEKYVVGMGASAELCQGVRLDQFTCLIGYSIQYESMTGSSFISYGTNIESPSHQDFRSSVINPS